MSCLLLCRCRQVVSKLVLLSEVLRLLSHYCSVVCSGQFLHHLVVIPDWSWVEVSVAPTHSFIIFLYCLLVVPLLVGSLFQQVYWCSQLPPPQKRFIANVHLPVWMTEALGYLIEFKFLGLLLSSLAAFHPKSRVSRVVPPYF